MTEPKNKGGRPAHAPTEATRKQVKALCAYGVPQAEICKVVGISIPTLEKHYRHELDVATAEANSQVAQSLFKKATGEGAQAVTAAIFWLKTRAGWKEPAAAVEVTGKDGAAIQTEDLNAREALLHRINSIATRESEAQGSGKPH